MQEVPENLFDLKSESATVLALEAPPSVEDDSLKDKYQRPSSEMLSPSEIKKQGNEDEWIRIDAVDLKKVSKNNTVLLDDISLSIPAGSLVALIGSSGAGKSTLMNAMSGFQCAHKGKVFYNEQDFYHNVSSFRTELGYVPQDNIVHDGLRVGRALYYAAKMRLPANYSRQQIEHRITEVLASVDLSDKRNMLISTLSGGQQKRVSIALELLDSPKVFFLDEPTSGLDAGLDYKMMHLLRKLAHEGQTIVVSTHATSNIDICDYICFLAPGGRLAYFGPPDKTLTFFQKDNFAGVYTMLDATPDHPTIPAEAQTRFKDSDDYREYIGKPLAERKSGNAPQKPKPSVKRCNGWEQLRLLCVRYLELLKHDTGNLLILLLQAPLIALLLVALMKSETGTTMFTQASITRCPTNSTVFTAQGLPNIPTVNQPAAFNDCSRVQNALRHTTQGKAYTTKRGDVNRALQDFIAPSSGEDAQKILFIMSFTAVLFGCVNAVREIVKEEPIYRRERSVHLGILPYMFSKIIVLGILCLVQDAILLLIVNAIAPIAQGGILFPPLLETYITLVLTSFSGLLIGLAVSAIVPTTDRAMSFIPLILIPQVIFSGTVFAFKNWFTQILAMLFTARWSIAALGSTIGLHSDRLGNDKLMGTQNTYCGTLFSTCSSSAAVTHLLWMWAALGIMILFFGVVVILFLKLKDLQYR